MTLQSSMHMTMSIRTSKQGIYEFDFLAQIFWTKESGRSDILLQQLWVFEGQCQGASVASIPCSFPKAGSFPLQGDFLPFYSIFLFSWQSQLLLWTTEQSCTWPPYDSQVPPSATPYHSPTTPPRAPGTCADLHQQIATARATGSTGARTCSGPTHGST